MADTYYLTKYALSTNGRITSFLANERDDGYVLHGKWNFHKVGRDAHRTAEDAIAAAETARTKKIASLRKQIAALEKLTFTVEESHG